MGSNYMSTVRLVTFSTTLLFSVIVMCLSADLISLTEPNPAKFAALALSTSLFSLVTVGPMLFIDFYRSGSFFSFIIVEVSWLSVLWVLWLSSGSYAAWTDQQIISLIPEESSCNFGVDFGLFSSAVTTGTQACHEIKAVMAFSFLTWILLMFYTIILLVLALRAQNQGHNVWQAAIRDGTLFYPSEKVVGGSPPMAAPQPTVYQSYPPPAQQTLPQSVSHPYTGSPQV